MGFAERLKELRNEKQCTQKQLALYLGLTANCVCEWENNRSEPSLNTICRLVEFFGVSADFLLGLEDDYGVKLTAQMGAPCTAEERQLVTKYRELNPACKKLINTTIETLVTTSTANKK